MDLGKILNDAFSYAQKLFSDLGRLLILLVLSIIPIVNFIMIGYAGQVAKESPEGNTPPPLKDYANLFIQGLMMILVGIVYMIIPIILLGIAFFSVFFFAIFGPAILGVTLILGIVGLVILFLVSIFAFMGMVHMLKQNNNFGKAFAFGEINAIIKKVGWGNYILWVIVTFVLVVILAVILAFIPIIGWLISFIISPAVAVFIYRSAASVYAEAHGYVAPSPPTTPPPAPSAPVAPPPPPAPKTQQTKIFCGNCGTANPPDKRFCYKCGQELTKS
jgi:hypothetical protein